MDTEHIRKTIGVDYIPFRLMIPEVVAEASQLFFDLFNGTYNDEFKRNLVVNAIYAIPKGDVAVVGAVAVSMDTYITDSVGTGGTLADDAGNPSPTTAAIVGLNPFANFNGDTDLPSGISARKEPTGGATLDQWVSVAHVFPEETNAALYALQNQNILRAPIIVPPNFGIAVKQGSVASLNSYSFIVDFDVY